MINYCSQKYSFDFRQQLEELEEHQIMDNELFHKQEFLELMNKTKMNIREQIKSYYNQPKYEMTLDLNLFKKIIDEFQLDIYVE